MKEKLHTFRDVANKDGIREALYRARIYFTTRFIRKWGCPNLSVINY